MKKAMIITYKNGTKLVKNFTLGQLISWVQSVVNDIESVFNATDGKEITMKELGF